MSPVDNPLLSGGNLLTTNSIDGGLMMVDFFPMTTKLNVDDLSMLVTFFPHSPPAFFLEHCCGGHHDDLMVRLSLFLLVAAIILVRPTVTPLSAPSFLRTHVGVRTINVGELFESGA